MLTSTPVFSTCFHDSILLGLFNSEDSMLYELLDNGRIRRVCIDNRATEETAAYIMRNYNKTPY
jgi:hypothetical protein